MGDQGFHRQRAAENQLGGLLLQLYRRAVAAEYRALSHANGSAGKFDALLIRSLSEQQDPRSGPRAGDGMFHQAGRRGGYDHQIRAAAFGQAADARDYIRLARIPRFEGATTARQLEAAGDGVGRVDPGAGAGQQHSEQQADGALSSYQYRFAGAHIALDYSFEAGV